jgi:hypothetical protein
MGEVMKKLVAAAAAFVSLAGAALAAPVTVGGVSFDTSNAATTVLWAQGGVFSGLTANRREACVDPTNPASTVGATGVKCRANEAAGFNLNEFVELDKNNGVINEEDVLAAFFAQPLVNGAGFDLVIYEAANQSDNPGVSIVLNGASIAGTVLGTVVVNGKKFTISAFDFSNSPLNIALGATIGQPIYIRTLNQRGSSDIAALVGINFGTPTPEIPLPAALPLFFAGLAAVSYTHLTLPTKA